MEWKDAFEGEEPGPHVPESVVPLSLGKFKDSLTRRASIRSMLTPLCESPIEVDLGSAILDLSEGKFDLSPQFRLGRYRYDFLIICEGRPLAFLECDGREFHSTEEQIANDKAKDDFAELHDLKVIRADGVEIYHHVDDVARRVIFQLSPGTKG